MKGFYQVLRDSFHHVQDITDPRLLGYLRAEGIQVDQEGYYEFSFGEHKEYELCIEPIGDEGHFLISLYKNRVLLVHKIPICVDEKSQQ